MLFLVEANDGEPFHGPAHMFPLIMKQMPPNIFLLSGSLAMLHEGADRARDLSDPSRFQSVESNRGSTRHAAVLRIVAVSNAFAVERSTPYNRCREVVMPFLARCLPAPG